MIDKIKKLSVADILFVSGLATLVGMLTFIAFEPGFLRGAASQFTVSMDVTGELSFSTGASNVTMGSVPGVTGGTTTGATQVIVTSNNAAGYTMTLVTSSTPAMQGEVNGGSIPDYTPAAGGVPDYTFITPLNTARFGYTVEASTTADLDQSFLDNGSNTCNSGGGGQTTDRCWLNASTSAETLILTSGATPTSGSTSTIKFQLTINPNPAPAIQTDTYTATNTLTATAN